MALSAEDSKAVEQHVAAVMKECPVCKGHTFSVVDDPGLYHLTVLGQTGRGVPFVAVVCDSCHYTMLFDARRIGVEIPE